MQRYKTVIKEETNIFSPDENWNFRYYLWKFIARERERKRERIQLKKWTNLCFNNGIEMGKINFNKEIEMRNINFNKEIEMIKINFVLF